MLTDGGDTINYAGTVWLQHDAVDISRSFYDRFDAAFSGCCHSRGSLPNPAMPNHPGYLQWDMKSDQSHSEYMRRPAQMRNFVGLVHSVPCFEHSQGDDKLAGSSELNKNRI